MLIDKPVHRCDDDDFVVISFSHVLHLFVKVTLSILPKICLVGALSPSSA